MFLKPFTWWAGLTDLLVDTTSETSVTLPAWDDSEGTIVLDDNDGTVRAFGWDSTGYTLVENGAVVEQYPYAWEDPPQSGGTTYYVSWSEGDDLNDGLSTGSPKKDPNFGSGVLQPGDSVLLKRGDTWPQIVVFSRSNGAVGNYIKYGAYGSGAKPIMDGEDAIQSMFGVNKIYWWIDNIDFRRGATNWPSNPFRGQLYFDSSASNCVVTNCVIRDSNGTGMDVHPDNMIIKDCVIHDNFGWGLYWRDTTDQTASGCMLLDTEFYGNAEDDDPNTGTTGTEACYGLARDMIVAGCYFHDNKTSDHELYRSWPEDSDSDAWQAGVRMHDNIFDSYGDTTKSFSPIGCKGRGGRVYRNRFIAPAWTGHGCTIAFAQDGGTPYNVTYSHHNLMVDVDQSAGWEGGSGFYIGVMNTKDAAGRGELNAHNNTVDGALLGFLVQSPDIDTDGNSLRVSNCLITNIGRDAADIEVDLATQEYDYNYYFNYPSFEVLGVSKTFAEWQGLGHDANGTDGTDPLYISGSDTDPNDRDYGLQTSSPARGVGTDEVFDVDNDPSSWIGINYVPHATSPDAGAHQYLSGKTLDFSKKLLGLTCASDTAAVFKLWDNRRDDATLLTDAPAP